jgi:hypothetical protein
MQVGQHTVSVSGRNGFVPEIERKICVGTQKKVKVSMKIQKCIYAIALMLVVLSMSACGGTDAPPAEETVDIDKFTYVNDDAGFGIIYPEDFVTLNQQEIDTVMADSIDAIRDMLSNPEEAEEAIRQSIPVSMTMKHPYDYTDGVNADITIIVYEFPFEMDNIVDIANEIAAQANIQSSGFMTFSDATAIQIDDRDVAVSDADLSIPDMAPVVQKQYYFLNDGYLAVITLSAGDEAEMDELTQIIDTIEFIK